jgi:hypothetical protein
LKASAKSGGFYINKNFDKQQMMKKLSFLFIIISNIICAQIYTVSEKQIEVTSHIYNSFILELNSGNTILLQMEPKIEGFLLKIYDNTHEERVSKKIKLENIKDINSVYVIDFIELNQNAVLFYAAAKDGVVNLHKLSINQITGETYTDICYSFNLPKDYTYFDRDLSFFKIIENQTKTKYSIIVGSSLDNQYHLNITVYNSTNNQIILKHSKTFDNYFHLDLLDAIMDNESIYLLVDRKYKPKDSEEKGWFKVTEVHYIPQNIASILKFNMDTKQIQDIKLNFLNNPTYSIKGQFNFDHKNNQLNLLLSCINPKDSYGKIPDVTNIFLKISKQDFIISAENEIKNTQAINKALSLYPDIKLDNNSFANFPQSFYTDSLGNNTFIFQTVYNKFNKPEGGSSLTRQEFAFLFCDSKTDVASTKFSPYKHAINGLLSGSLDQFSFHCNKYTMPHHPRYYSYDKDYYQFKTFEVDHKIVTILNLNPENLDKNINDQLVGNTEKEVMIPMILCVNKNFYEYNKVFTDSEKYGKLRFNVNVSSFNQKTKSYVVLATELGGKRERLVWIKFN